MHALHSSQTWCCSGRQKWYAARYAARTMSALCLMLAVAACSEESEDEVVSRPPPAPPAIYQLDHLDAAEHVSPEQWLASREAGQDLPQDDPRVIAVKRTLEMAGRHFREYPRMIANRAVQLETMLRQKGFDEAAPQLIARIDAIPGERRYVESFGGLCQHYYNLRTQGYAPDEAYKLLKERADAS